MGSGNLLVIRRHLWIQGYKKRDPFLLLKSQREMLFE
ncbi:hypothetical protein Gorai_017849 [Gossypium raimondii]|uniref:Uncharacterized protein n=1 Tax=Gossypium raimondii TaxID=29730 RepID=A0A7J8PIX1_GOSRA|nr:hypothetical protein [Gossypium raimondii]